MRLICCFCDVHIKAKTDPLMLASSSADIISQRFNLIFRIIMYCACKIFLAVVLIIGLTSAAVVIPREAYEKDLMKQFFKNECKKDKSWMCLKLELMNFIEKFSEEEELKIVPGMSLVRDFNVTQHSISDIIAG